MEGKLDEAKIKEAAGSTISRAPQEGGRGRINADPPKRPMGQWGGWVGNGPLVGQDGGRVIRHGSMGGEYDQSGQRDEKAIKYIPLKEIDKAVKEGNLPAFTVIPLRLVTVHAVVPYKKQLEEIKRALRALRTHRQPSRTGGIERPRPSEVWGPWYDGFEVQRRVTKSCPTGRSS